MGNGKHGMAFNHRPLASAFTSSHSSSPSSWLLDSGASSHLCNNPHLFSSLHRPSPGSGVRFGGALHASILPPARLSTFFLTPSLSLSSITRRPRLSPHLSRSFLSNHPC
ncbi:hypothetical protein CLOM_g4929 [Closterium sp. NIES-68]|nr:hypothetical protein CLOM_g4929 [Closterium sp. NIES-68]